MIELKMDIHIIFGTAKYKRLWCSSILEDLRIDKMEEEYSILYGASRL
jgi:hypothetical protein